MPWGLFSVALLIVYLLQSAMLGHFAPAWLDLFLAFALLCGLAGPLWEARLAGWIVGLAQDVGTDGPLGIHALALGLTVLLLTRMREAVNRELWWVRWLVGFLVAVPAQLLVQVHDRYFQGAAVSWPHMLGHALLTALVAALLAALAVRLPVLLRRRRSYSAARW
jgi:rod shape-determining protein MreD